MERGGRGEFNVWTDFFQQQIIIFFRKDIDDDDDYEDECYAKICIGMHRGSDFNFQEYL
jgi:hypothetical protein